MDKLKSLTAAQCLVLAVSLSTDANISSLRLLALSRSDIFDLELILRILLSYLPESVEPQLYVDFLSEVSLRTYGKELDHEDIPGSEQPLDCSSVSLLSAKEARDKLSQVHLQPLRSTQGSNASTAVLRCAPDDPLVLFLISRAHAIDVETGLLPAVPHLIRPFVARSLFLRIWYLSNVLPLLRFEYEYYTEKDPAMDLAMFEDLEEPQGIQILMSKSAHTSREGKATAEIVGRDLKGLVGPWICGSSQRKRRRLGYQALPMKGEQALRKYLTIDGQGIHKCRVGKCGTDFQDDSSWRVHMEDTHKRVFQSVKEEMYQGDGAVQTIMSGGAGAFPQLDYWKYTFDWIIDTAASNFPLAVAAIEGWGGPSDVDIGDDNTSIANPPLADESMDDVIHRQYCQAAYAAVYTAEKDDAETIEGAHTILSRLAQLLCFEPPPDLATTVDLLPKIEQNDIRLGDMPRHLLHSESLMTPDQPLTKPGLPSFGLLQMFIYSAYLLAQLGSPISIASVSKLCFWSDMSDALRLLQRILQGLVEGPKQYPEKWSYARDTVIWLWDWGLQHGPEGPKDGYGVFGRIPRDLVEKEILKAFCSAEHYALATETYLTPQSPPLPSSSAEDAILSLAYSFYDAASNGNKTRGSMKRASALLSAFRTPFANSPAYRRAEALITATHALSFYTLTLSQGVPTLPSTIRQTSDPLSLITILLSQTQGSYANLDDLISMGHNLTLALPTTSSSTNDLTDLVSRIATTSTPTTSPSATPSQNIAQKQATARRITAMAIESALSADDFETAYSYVVNRLSHPLPSSQPLSQSETQQQHQQQQQQTDALAAHAALLAGRHPTPLFSSHSTAQPPTQSQIRRVEQRMELLAHALLLSLAPQLPETLAAWRRCEEQLLNLLNAEAEAEREADDAADRGDGQGGGLPGAFADGPGLSVQAPRRREVGRGATEEAPMGLFDVARGAARALSRNVGDGSTSSKSVPGTARSSTGGSGAAGSGMEGEGEDEATRVRKRDVVASAVTGGFARGVGWVLGAAPVGGDGARDERSGVGRGDG